MIFRDKYDRITSVMIIGIIWLSQNEEEISMKKKVISLMAVMALAGALAVGCGEKAKETEAKTEAKTEAAETEAAQTEAKTEAAATEAAQTEAAETEAAATEAAETEAAE